jgi:hypothetical protein
MTSSVWKSWSMIDASLSGLWLETIVLLPYNVICSYEWVSSFKMVTVCNHNECVNNGWHSAILCCHTHTHINTHINTDTYTYKCICTHTREHTPTHISIKMYRQHAHTSINTCVTHIHTHTETHLVLLLPFPVLYNVSILSRMINTYRISTVHQTGIFRQRKMTRYS